MLRRDYLLKLIQDLFAAIADLLERDGDELEKQKQIEALYSEFGADKNFFRTASDAEMIATVARVAADANGIKPDEVGVSDMCQRLELLATLLYADYKLSDLSDGVRLDVASRALSLFRRVDESSDCYSLDRLSKIEELANFVKSNSCIA